MPSNSCEGNCYHACESVCMQGCGSSCTGGCKTGCNSGCLDSCVGSCTGKCGGVCSSVCADICEGTCGGKCTNTCSILCRGLCDDTCTKVCADDCSGGCIDDCGRGCSVGCYHECESVCSQSCIGTCTKDCASGCSNVCSFSCMYECKGTCRGGCLGCGGGCSGSCLLTCDTECTTECHSNCKGTSFSVAIYVSGTPSYGGTVSGSGSYKYQSTAIISAQENTGYTWGGWTGSSSVSSRSFNVYIDSDLKGKNLVYTAKFEYTDVTINVIAGTLDGATVGSVSPTSLTVRYSSSMVPDERVIKNSDTPSLKSTATPNDYYRFTKGQYVTSTGGIEDVPSSGVSILSKDNSLIARFAKNIYRTYFDGNGGTPSVEYQEGEGGTELKATATWACNEFKGWYTLPEGGTEVKTIQIPYMSESNKVYAHWDVKQYTVKYSRADGSGDNLTYDVNVGESHSIIGLPSGWGVRKGYSLVGVGENFAWNTHADGSGSWGTPGTSKTITENFFLYLVWKPKTYTVTYKSSGSVIYEDHNQKYGEIYNIPSYGYRRLGYLNYGTNTTSGDKIYDENKYTLKYTVDSDSVVEAHGTQAFTITLDASYYKEQGITKYIYGAQSVDLSTVWFKDIECKEKVTTIAVPAITKYKTPGQGDFKFNGYYDGLENLCVDVHGKIMPRVSTLMADETGTAKTINVVWVTIKPAEGKAGAGIEYTTPQGEKYFEFDESSHPDILAEAKVVTPGYKFDYWYRGGTTKISDNISIQIPINVYTNGAEYTATASIKYIEISTVIRPDTAKGSIERADYKIQEGHTFGAEAVETNKFYKFIKGTRKKKSILSSWEDIPSDQGYIISGNRISFIVDEDKGNYTYAANFEYSGVELKLNTNPDIPALSNLLFGADLYAKKETVKVSAKDSGGGKFNSGFEGSTYKSTSNPYYFLIEKDTTLTALYSIDVETAILPSSKLAEIKKRDGDEGKDGNYSYGSELKILCEIKSEYKEDTVFKHGKLETDGRVIIIEAEEKENPTLDLLITAPVKITAVLSGKDGDYFIEVSTTEPDYSTVSGEGWYYEGDLVEISCYIKDDYVSKYFFEKGKERPNNDDPSFKVNVFSDLVYTAIVKKLKFKPLLEGEEIDGVIYYLPYTDKYDCGVPQPGYSPYLDYDYNPIVNKYYRTYISEDIDIIQSNCTGFADGRTAQIAGADLSGISGGPANACNGFDSCYLSGEREPLPGSNDVKNFYVGDILCYVGKQHVEIVEGVNSDGTLDVSLGGYPAIDRNVKNTSRYTITRIQRPEVGKGRVFSSGSTSWSNCVFKGVIHNPYVGRSVTSVDVYAQSVPNSAGTTTVDGVQHVQKEVGDYVELLATPQVIGGHYFYKWWDGSKENPRTYQIEDTDESVLNCTAYYDGYEPGDYVSLRLAVSPTEGGYIYCDGSKGSEFTFKKGTSVTLSAEPYIDPEDETKTYHFVRWSNTDSSDTVQQITLNENMTIIASFSLQGSGPGGSAEYDKNELITLFGEGCQILLKSISFDIGVYNFDFSTSSQTNYFRPSMTITLYLSDGTTQVVNVPQSDSEFTYTGSDINKNVDDIDIKLNSDYEENSLIINSITISYSGGDEDLGEVPYTRYYNGEKWTEGTEEETKHEKHRVSTDV